jgi:hypothetical protein
MAVTLSAGVCYLGTQLAAAWGIPSQVGGWRLARAMRTDGALTGRALHHP